MLLSVLIPAREEMFLAQTVRNVLENAQGETEVIAVLDGYEPEDPLPVDDRVKILRFAESIGQRAATNAAAMASEAKYVMKLDAHCAGGPGFDVILAGDCQPDWTMVPAMWNLHSFDWRCMACGNRTYQGSRPAACEKCQAIEFERIIVWKPRKGRLTLSWRFDSAMHFQYWKAHHRLPQWKDEPLVETMSCIGACMFLERDRYWALDGMDLGHGSWGQYGTEVAAKAWLSGGKLVTTRKTWFAHMFRTGNFNRDGEGSFPYPLPLEAQEHARVYSRDLWKNGKWPKAVRSLSWLVERFWPVPGWTEADLQEQRQRDGLARTHSVVY